MKYLALLCMLFFCTLQTFSQQDYFIYLQTDNNQAFYIRLNNSVYSSSSTGYLILPKLADSTATLTIGFAKNVYPEQQFNVPVNHKDAGYVLKNFGDKGWGLFNLQTSVVIRSNSADEKKKPELTGSKRNDAFSMLLSNAVNDTSVLYTVNKPPKPTLPPVPVADEQKRDTFAVAKTDLPKKEDTAAFVKRITEKKDSILVAQNTPQIRKEADTTVNLHLPESKKTGSIAKNAKAVTGTIATVKNTKRKVPARITPAKNTAKRDSVIAARNAATHNKDTISVTSNTHIPEIIKTDSVAKNPTTLPDTIAVAKNTKPKEPAHTTPSKTIAKKDSVLTAKNETRHNKDTIIITNDTHMPVSRHRAALAKNKKERKDTIIMMNGSKPKDLAKNTIPVKEKTPNAEQAKDTLQLIKKEIMQAPEEKRDALLNNRDAVVIEKIPAKKDTGKQALKKDTLEILAANEPIVPAQATPDTIVNAPVRRLRPLVNKVAELLTDTSYIAVFVDESKDKFDTIRLSIPFNELTANAKPQKPAATPADSDADKITTAGVPAGSANKMTPAAVKNDTVTADKIAKENTAVITRQNIPAPLAPAIKTGATPTEKSPVKDSIPAMDNREPAMAATKKDSVPLQADSGRIIKTPQALLLNSDCKEIALDSDIDKLRIKMMLVTSDEDRIALGRRLFKQKCFLVKHVRALSELFKNDEGKYKWLDATYPFVSDTGNFSTLSDLITDNYYLNRFKAMVRH